MSSNESFDQQLETLYGRYRREHLDDRLTELAETMEETLLHKAVADAFFEASVQIDTSVKKTVEGAIETLESGDYDTIENNLSEIEDEVEQAETRVTNQVQELRINREETVTAMQRLNERVDRVDSAQVKALKTLLDDWNWRPMVYTEDNATLEERRQEATQYGEDMSSVYHQLKHDLFKRYDGTELRPLVDRLLDEDRLRLGELSETEREQLAKSDLADDIELKLS
ncbi:hypothetical protein [Halobacteriaceae bacterium SHR40]|uniref:hypothetical protein n=1 Tax=Halovenus amylolytica TaxID=2500550 RepID=UPI000FE2E682